MCVLCTCAVVTVRLVAPVTAAIPEGTQTVVCVQLDGMFQADVVTRVFTMDGTATST